MNNEHEVRLRRQIEELVRSRLGLLEQDISRLQREVNESFTRLLERTDTAATLPESDQLLAQIGAEVTAQIDRASADSVRLGADIALLRDSVVELDVQTNQADVLNALVARAANFAPRVVLFVVKGANALAWAARGFEDSGGNGAIRGLAISLQADTALRAALNSQQTFYGSPEEQAENTLIFTRFGNVHPHRLLAVPLSVRGKSAAVLYADSEDHGEEATSVEAIELLVHTAGLVVELVSLRARMTGGAQPSARPQPASTPAPAQERQPESSPAPTPDAARPAAQPNYQAATPPVAEASPSPSTAPLRSPAISAPETGAADEAREPAPEAPAYSKTASEPQQTSEPYQISEAHQTSEPQEGQPPAPPAQYSMEPDSTGAAEARPADPASPPASSGATPQSSRAALLSEEEKQHNDARRFARLLVSEIKLYNEQKVSDGRRNNDLYDRLKEDIDRSRQMYKKRVAPMVAAKFDYFHDELVNTLAEGDEAKLGSDHPGPSVGV